MRTIEDYGYIINPPDCKEGDEWFDGRWKPCRVAIEDTPEYIKRRRRIDVGEGFELVGLDEVPGWVEYTIDGQHWADNGWYNCNVREIIKRRPEILAIRRRKKVEPVLTKVYPIWVKVGERTPNNRFHHRVMTVVSEREAWYNVSDKLWYWDRILISAIPTNGGLIITI